MAIKRKPVIPDGWSVFLIGFVKIDLDDISDVIRFIEDKTNDVSLTAADATFDDVNDLVNATKEELRDVAISSKNLGLVVQLGHRGTYAGARSDSDESVELAYDLYRLIRKRRTNLPVGRGAVFLYLLCLGAAALIPLTFLGLIEAKFQWDLLPYAAAPVLYVWLAVSGYRAFRVRGGATVYPLRHGERRTRWREMVLWIGSIIAAGVISALLTYWQLASSQ